MLQGSITCSIHLKVLRHVVEVALWVSKGKHVENCLPTRVGGIVLRQCSLRSCEIFVVTAFYARCGRVINWNGEKMYRYPLLEASPRIAIASGVGWPTAPC